LDDKPVPPEAVTDDGNRAAVHAAAEAIRSLNLPPEAIEAAGIIAGTAVINATPHLLRAAAPAIRADERRESLLFVAAEIEERLKSADPGREGRAVMLADLVADLRHAADLTGGDRD